MRGATREHQAMCVASGSRACQAMLLHVHQDHVLAACMPCHCMHVTGSNAATGHPIELCLLLCPTRQVHVCLVSMHFCRIVDQFMMDLCT